MTPIEMPPELRYLFDRISNDDASALDRLFAGSVFRQGLDELLTELAQTAREEEGFSWAEVGKVLDITKQAAQQRFGKQGVVRVSSSGEVTVSGNRRRYEAALRNALAQRDGEPQLPDGYEPQIVEVEVEVRVEKPTNPNAKPNAQAKAKKAPTKSKAPRKQASR